MLNYQDAIQGAKINQYNFHLGSTWFGLTVQESAKIMIAGEYIDMTSDQLSGILKSTVVGFPVTIEARLQNVNTSFIAKLLKGQVREESNGVSNNIGLGTEKRESTEFAQELYIHPEGVDPTDFSNDAKFWKAYVKVTDLQLLSSRTQYQDINITINIQPDKSKPVGYEYGVLGDWSLGSVTPNFVIVTADNTGISKPYKTEKAISVDSGSITRMTAYAVNMTSSGVTALVNGAKLATDTVLAFDTLSVVNGLKVGQIIQLSAGDYCHVISVDYGASTITVDRGVGNITALAIADNDTITIMSEAGVIPVRDISSWASSAGSVAIVGNTYAGVSSNNKGVITAISSGNANITATYNAVVSNAIAYTVV